MVLHGQHSSCAVFAVTHASSTSIPRLLSQADTYTESLARGWSTEVPKLGKQSKIVKSLEHTCVSGDAIQSSQSPNAIALVSPCLWRLLNTYICIKVRTNPKHFLLHSVQKETVNIDLK